ncbi:MAG: glyoxalase [Acidimicrobiia bacterium]|nr:glyoxalase [Acidimicrobiia bacterium]
MDDEALPDPPLVGVRITQIDVGDAPEAWAAAGFAMQDSTCWLGHTAVTLVGSDGPRRILSWELAGIDADGLDDSEDGTALDGLPTRAVTKGGAPPAGVVHPNGAQLIDHVVILSPDHDRTVAAFEAVGLPPRRTRSTDIYGGPMLQTFFRAGPTIIELVAPPTPLGDGPCGFFGLALTVADLDHTVEGLGEHLGRVKDAVQPGRRITTLRHKALGMSVAIAFMDPEPPREG